ncbi:MAG: hypothetical protein H8E94_08640, partial [Alphaproteobacteria bacterium]|nr:hypothetical protein [Alphaproteobacteria bacterium]
MSLEADYIVERRRLKRRLLFWRILALVIIGVAAITTLTNIEDIAKSDHIARLNVSGIIVDARGRARLCACVCGWVGRGGVRVWAVEVRLARVA